MGKDPKRGWDAGCASVAAFPEGLVMAWIAAQYPTALQRSWHPGAKLELGIPFRYFKFFI